MTQKHREAGPPQLARLGPQVYGGILKASSNFVPLRADLTALIFRVRESDWEVAHGAETRTHTFPAAALCTFSRPSIIGPGIQTNLSPQICDSLSYIPSTPGLAME